MAEKGQWIDFILLEDAVNRSLGEEENEKNNDFRSYEDERFRLADATSFMEIMFIQENAMKKILKEIAEEKKFILSDTYNYKKPFEE